MRGGNSQYVGHRLPFLDGEHWGLWLRRLEARMGGKFGLILVIQEWIIRRVANGYLLRNPGFAFADGLLRAPGGPRSSWRPWSDKRLGSDRPLDLPSWLAP